MPFCIAVTDESDETVSYLKLPTAFENPMRTYNPGQTKVSFKKNPIFLSLHVTKYSEEPLSPPHGDAVDHCHWNVTSTAHEGQHWTRGGVAGEGLCPVRYWTRIILSPQPTTILTSIVETVASCTTRLNTYFHSAWKHPRNAHGGLACQSSPAPSPGPSSGD